MLSPSLHGILFCMRVWVYMLLIKADTESKMRLKLKMQALNQVVVLLVGDDINSEFGMKWNSLVTC
jgi:hypothetical protein